MCFETKPPIVEYENNKNYHLSCGKVVFVGGGGLFHPSPGLKLAFPNSKLTVRQTARHVVMAVRAHLQS